MDYDILWAVIFFLFAISSIIIPLTLSCKYFNKGDKDLYKKSLLTYILIYCSPGYTNGSSTLVIDSFPILMLFLWLMGGASAFGIVLFNYYCILKNFAKITHDDFAFNNATNSITIYGFLYFTGIGLLIIFVGDSEPTENGFSEFKYIGRAWIYLLIEIVHLTGFFFTTIGQYYIIKYDLSKWYLAILMITQIISYTFNLSYIFDFQILYVVIILVLGIINLSLGIHLWVKFRPCAEPNDERNSVSEDEQSPQLISNYSQVSQSS